MSVWRFVTLIAITLIVGVPLTSFTDLRGFDILAERPEISPTIRVMIWIPEKYTCDGEDVSPPVLWDIKTLPNGTKSLALVMFDPDAPHRTFTHWIVYNVNPMLGGLPENIPKQPVIEGIGVQGVNDFGQIGYGGPCPPPGPPHRYFIRILALDQMLELRPGLSIEEFRVIVRDHIIGYGDIVGIYGRGQG